MAKQIWSVCLSEMSADETQNRLIGMALVGVENMIK